MKDIKKLREAANRYAELARSLQEEGLFDEAELGFEAAASIDLADAELQKCWGGPFNGQIARRDLVQKIIQVWDPVAIIETGTFRGKTTEWFAENTSIPIYTCEKNKRFFLQSQQRLAKWENVHLALQDSRDFICQIAGTDISQKRVFFYLDAHGDQDLPLRDEISIIFQLFKLPCVIVDDFKVPFDSGYFFDDYGPGKVFSLEILDGLLSPEIQIAYPLTPSEIETGERRGAIILMRKESADVIASTNLVRWGDYRDWHITELERNCAERMKQIEELTRMLQVSKADMMAQLAEIEKLQHRLQISEADRAARLVVIEDQGRQLGRIPQLEAEKAQLVAEIDSLQRRLHNLQSQWLVKVLQRVKLIDNRAVPLKVLPQQGESSTTPVKKVVFPEDEA